MLESRVGWVLAALLVFGCGGRARSEDGAMSHAGASSAGANGDAGGPSCPDSAPAEGAACSQSGERCAGYGSLSCPETARCVNGHWELNCPATMLGGGACDCPHHTLDEVPLEHRPRPAVCPEQRGPSTGSARCVSPDGGASCAEFECSQDSECTASKNGRCQPALGGHNACNYDECFSDSDCGKDSVCQCRGSAADSAANICSQGFCLTDADCASGYCSPSQAHEWCPTFYACHNDRDQCKNDSDCPSGVHCDFDGSVQYWVCSNGCGAPPPG